MLHHRLCSQACSPWHRCCEQSRAPDLKAANGPGNPWLGAMDFDPEHNVVVLFSFRDKRVWAYRHKEVAAGTKATITAAQP